MRILRVAVVDYGAGNLHSLVKALAHPGFDVGIEPEAERAAAADVIVLPGVGAFGHAARALEPGREALRRAIIGGAPTLGICLGMQLLFESSDEGDGRGLAIIPGSVTRLDAKRLPQIGWNTIEATSDPLFATARLEQAYYANSFCCRPEHGGAVTAWSSHENDRFPAAVRQASAVGVQFHPEKSSTAGVRFIRAFLQQARRRVPGTEAEP